MRAGDGQCERPAALGALRPPPMLTRTHLDPPLAQGENAIMKRQFGALSRDIEGNTVSLRVRGWQGGRAHRMGCVM